MNVARIGLSQKAKKLQNYYIIKTRLKWTSFLDNNVDTFKTFEHITLTHWALKCFTNGA